MKKAFTLAEVMIVLAIIGFIALFSLSSFKNALPEKKKVAFKKAYSVVERIAGELVNDESIYPYDRNTLGFRNMEEAKQSATLASCRTGQCKFCSVFAEKLNIIGEEKFNIGTRMCSFETTDGAYWEVQGFSELGANMALANRTQLNCDAVTPSRPKAAGCTPPYNMLKGSRCYIGSAYNSCQNNNKAIERANIHNVAIVRVDVDGKNNGANTPNRSFELYRSGSITNNATLRTDLCNTSRDRFFIFIAADGQVSVPTTYTCEGKKVLEAQYLEKHSAQ